MEINSRSVLFHFLFYACWVAIIYTGFVFLKSNISPMALNPTIRSIKIPDIDPLIYTDHRSGLMKVPPIGTKLNLKLFYERRKEVEFYSTVDHQAYSEVFYRPDFKNNPVETSMVQFFRIVTFIGLVLFLFFLSKIFESVYRENPFDPKNHQRIFYMGLIMVVLPIIRTLHSAVLAGLVKYDPALFAWVIKPAYFYLWLSVIGIFILSLSYLFKEGARMYDELKLTI